MIGRFLISSQAKINLPQIRLPLLTKLCVSICNTNAEVDLFDHNRLGDSGMLVKRFEAILKGLGAKTADKDRGENLPAEVYYSLGSRVMLAALITINNLSTGGWSTALLGRFVILFGKRVSAQAMISHQ
jgi:hypothetical protein